MIAPTSPQIAWANQKMVMKSSGKMTGTQYRQQVAYNKQQYMNQKTKSVLGSLTNDNDLSNTSAANDSTYMASQNVGHYQTQ